MAKLTVQVQWSDSNDQRGVVEREIGMVPIMIKVRTAGYLNIHFGGFYTNLPAVNHFHGCGLYNSYLYNAMCGLACKSTLIC